MLKKDVGKQGRDEEQWFQQAVQPCSCTTKLRRKEERESRKVRNEEESEK